MSRTNTITYRLDQVEKVAVRLILPLCRPGTIFRLEGGLGAGKTTLVKSVMAVLGVTEPVLSPTFAYVNSYQTGRNLTAHHFDIYRVDSVSEFCAMGLDSYLYDTSAVSFIEWPGAVTSLLDSFGSRVVTLSLAYGDDIETTRILSIEGVSHEALRGDQKGLQSFSEDLS